MVKLDFDTRGLHANFKRFEDKRVAGLKKQVEISANRIESDAKKRAPVGVDGLLWASIKIRRLDSGETAQIGVGVAGKKLPYAATIEFGMKPGTFPPYGKQKSLFRWVRLKLGIIAKEVKGVTYLVARKIYEEGFKGTPYLVPAFKREKPLFERALKQIMK